MTGLLHRLAARANGTAWTVRADARLPFGAPAFREGEGEGAWDTGAPARSPHRPATSTMPAAASSPMHEHPTAAVQPAAPPALLAAAQAARSPALPATPAAPPPQALRMPGVHAQTPASQSSAHGTLQPSAMVATHDAATRATQAVPPQPAPEASDTPSPLLPPLRAEPGRPRTAATVPPTGSRTTAVAQPAPARDTEVHIHIGRIDVTAVHEAPKPRPRPRERAQPVSLDAYLAKRGTAG